MSRVIHFEVVGKDPEKLAEFYRKAFGWKVEKWEGPTDYWLISTGDPEQPGIDGGLGLRASEKEDPFGLTMSVDDCQAAVDEVLAAGGKLVSEKHAIPGVGWMAYCADVDGNVFGMMQSDPEAK
jgi:hypothetical protein